MASVPLAQDEAGAGKAGKERQRYAIGTRFGIGNAFNWEGHLMLGFWEYNRLDLGANIGFLFNDYGISIGFEALGFYEWKYDITKDGFLSWYAGPGLAIGYMGMAWIGDYEYKSSPNATAIVYPVEMAGAGLTVAAGGNAGIELNFAAFIDENHTLSNLKDLAVSRLKSKSKHLTKP